MILKDYLGTAQNGDQNGIGNKQRTIVERKICETPAVTLEKIIWNFIEDYDRDKTIKGGVRRPREKDVQIYAEYFSFQMDYTLVDVSI